MPLPFLNKMLCFVIIAFGISFTKNENYLDLRTFMINLKDETILAYRSGVGMWAFVLHRITGLALIFYLLMHITVISTSLKGPNAFNQLLALLTSPLFVVLDLGLLAAVLFHGLNGVRIVLFDTGVGIRQQKAIFWVLMAIAAVIWFWTLYLTVPHIVIPAKAGIQSTGCPHPRA